MEHTNAMGHLLDQLEPHLKAGCGKVLIQMQLLSGALTLHEAIELAKRRGLQS